MTNAKKFESADFIKFLARAEDGSINREATVAAFTSALNEYAARAETEESQIAALVDACFGTVGKGGSLPANYIAHFVIGEMAKTGTALDNATYALLDKNVKEYLHRNAGERGKAMFQVKKAKGYALWRDLPVEAPKA